MHINIVTFPYFSNFERSQSTKLELEIAKSNILDQLFKTICSLILINNKFKMFVYFYYLQF